VLAQEWRNKNERALRCGAVRDFIRNLQFLRWHKTRARAASRKHLAPQNVSLAFFEIIMLDERALVCVTQQQQHQFVCFIVISLFALIMGRRRG